MWSGNQGRSDERNRQQGRDNNSGRFRDNRDDSRQHFSPSRDQNRDGRTSSDNQDADSDRRYTAQYGERDEGDYSNASMSERYNRSDAYGDAQYDDADDAGNDFASGGYGAADGEDSRYNRSMRGMSGRQQGFESGQRGNYSGRSNARGMRDSGMRDGGSYGGSYGGNYGGMSNDSMRRNGPSNSMGSNRFGNSNMNNSMGGRGMSNGGQYGQQWQRGAQENSGYYGNDGGMYRQRNDADMSGGNQSPWTREQGLYGSNEYGGYMSGQRSQSRNNSFAGKGPKGWQRSDERIRDEVSEALSRHDEIDASDIEVEVQNGEITLSGTVRDRNAKRMAEDIAEQVFGVSEVQNHIRVSRDDRAMSASDSQRSSDSRSTSAQGDREIPRATERDGKTTDAQDKNKRGNTGANINAGSSTNATS